MICDMLASPAFFKAAMLIATSGMLVAERAGTGFTREAQATSDGSVASQAYGW